MIRESIRSLEGRTILVTRPAERSERLVELLDVRGARTIVAPTIAIRPIHSTELTRALLSLAAGDFEWVVLTSPATVAMLAERLESPIDVRALVAAIGDGTSEAFSRWAERPVDLQPASSTTKALARSLPRGTGRVLCARADIAPQGLEDSLASKGWTPTRVDAYRTTFPKRLPRVASQALARGEVDAITFTSASTVRGFVGATRTEPSGGDRRRPKNVCIGPVTSKEARAHGLIVHSVADPHTTDGLVVALERVFTPRTGGKRRADPDQPGG